MAIRINNIMCRVAQKKIGQDNCGVWRNGWNIYINAGYGRKPPRPKLTLASHLYWFIKQAYSKVTSGKAFGAIKDMDIYVKLILLVKMTLKQIEFKIMLKSEYHIYF